MTERISLSLWETNQAHKALMHAWGFVKPWILSGHRLTLEIRPEKRSDAQNRLLHACLSEISKKVEWAGAKRDVDTWKRLLTAAWLRTRGEHIEMLPALDGHGVDIVFRRTSQLTKSECAELSEFVMAWAADHEVYAAEGGQ
ncbi:recombination protein NinB [Comamonas testosteroni]